MRQSGIRVCRAGWCAFALVLAVNACSSEERLIINDAQGALAEEQSTGVLRLPLITADTATYRLRDASFEIARSGAALLTLSTDDEPDAEALTADLDPGQYTGTLADGWTLELLNEDGSASPVRAALISQNPARFSVRNGRTTVVAYSFTTSDGVVSFGQGEVSVRIGVTEPETLSSCDVASAGSCPSGQHCLIGESGSSFCASPGTLPLGSPCASEQCVAGAQCLTLQGTALGQGVCTELCNPEAPFFGCDCRGLSISDTIGVCGPPPANSCDLLDPMSCSGGLTCQYPGGSFGVCGEPGTVAEGNSCFGEECEAGLDCVGDDPDFGFLGTCRRFCDLDNPECEFCFDAGTGRVGRCFL